MIEKSNESSPKSSDSMKFQQENESETPPNFKLLYRKTPNPERDRSSGVSSDEETTSSSLVPIPDSLKNLGNNSKWTMSESGDHSDSPYSYGILGDSTGNIMNSLEELRKKYTLKNEASVTLKMNSANQMLDDILNSANMKSSLNSNLQYRTFRKEDYLQKTSPESETSTTESSVSRCEPCTYVTDVSHLPIALDYYPPPCPRHFSASQVLHSSLSTKDKDPITSGRNLDINQRKKSLVEKLQDLQIRCRIQSVYKNLQKTRNPFTKFKKDPESLNVPQGMNRLEADSLNVLQGIPGCEGDTLTDTEQPPCQCELVCPLSQFSKKMILDLVEPSDMSQTESRSSERDDRHFMFINHRKCTCPEVLPRCACRELSYQVSETSSESIRQNSEVASKTEEQTQVAQSGTPSPMKNENETNFLVEKENEENKVSKHSLKQNRKGWKKYCSKERNLIERTDIYYFDHGNSAYYKTTDNHPMRYTECLVERTDEYATKFWAEFFGTIEIGIAFLISFVLQLYRFLFTSIIRSLTVGLLQIFSDYLFKPLLTIIFNGIIQPCLILVYNITTSFRDLCLPISQIFGFFARELAGVLRSCRLVEVNQPKEPSCICGNKV